MKYPNFPSAAYSEAKRAANQKGRESRQKIRGTGQKYRQLDGMIPDSGHQDLVISSQELVIPSQESPISSQALLPDVNILPDSLT